MLAGNNVWGQLGLGTQQPTTHFTAIRKLLSLDVAAVQAGDSTSAVGVKMEMSGFGAETHISSWALVSDISRWAPVQLQGFKAVHPGRCYRDWQMTGMPQ